MDEAIRCYTSAIETLTPLDNKGIGEVKYDIAGMKLNRGQIFHELGEFDKANKDYDEAFLAFRAVEKISDLDARFYMAKVSVAQGSLYRDMGEPLEKIVDAYNRAMRLFVELIDIGQMEHEQELANVLMDRCNVTYESYMQEEFESDAVRTEKFDAVLLDVSRAIETLQKIAATGDPDARSDVFHAITTQGAMLLDLERFAEALAFFDQVIKDYADFEKETDPVLINQFAAAFENRGFALMNLDRAEEALAAFDRAIADRKRLQTAAFDLDDDDRQIFVPSLATAYANRAAAYAALKKMDEAKADCRQGIQLLQPLKSSDNEDLEEIEEIETMLKSLLEAWA
jgi:tetratricopeptide (TPR) repeat protein